MPFKKLCCFLLISTCVLIAGGSGATEQTETVAGALVEMMLNPPNEEVISFWDDLLWAQISGPDFDCGTGNDYPRDSSSGEATPSWDDLLWAKVSGPDFDCGHANYGVGTVWKWHLDEYNQDLRTSVHSRAIYGTSGQAINRLRSMPERPRPTTTPKIRCCCRIHQALRAVSHGEKWPNYRDLNAQLRESYNKDFYSISPRENPFDWVISNFMRVKTHHVLRGDWRAGEKNLYVAIRDGLTSINPSSIWLRYMKSQ